MSGAEGGLPSPAHMATGLAVFIAEKRAELAPGAEELDWEDEWDDLTLQQQTPYIERATAVSQTPAPAPASPEAVWTP